MRVLWLCNIMLPEIANQLSLEASRKEGWLTGLFDRLMREEEQAEKAGKEPAITLGVCFPSDDRFGTYSAEMERENGGKFRAFGFTEKLLKAEKYDPKMEKRFEEILEEFDPDAIHVFGTEYPHVRAMLEVAENLGKADKVVLNLQGICTEIAKAYRAGLPEHVWKRRTFRDVLKRDSLRRQQRKMEIRGDAERAAVRKARHVIGRTAFDKHWMQIQNPNAAYHLLNETLRGSFYDGSRWGAENCEPHRIFMSQGDYPLKGLHYVLQALPKVLEKYPDTTLYVAGNSIIKTSLAKGPKRITGKLKLESYGVYIRDLIKSNKLKDHVVFLGSIDAEEMKKQYLQANVYVCASTNENSPNSVGEAMILGVPAVCSRVGGIPSLFAENADGVMFVPEDIEGLAGAICHVFAGGVAVEMQTAHARAHALSTHDPETNYRTLLKIYAEIAAAP